MKPISCDLKLLVEEYPMMIIPSRPTTAYESVYLKGTASAGNFCPSNTSTPAQTCQGGTYCPAPGVAEECPAGYYCKPGSIEPARCPPLAACPAGSSQASLSWAGFIMLAATLVAIMLAYLAVTATIRINQRRLLRTQEARERLWKLLTPLFAPRGSSRTQGFRAFKAIRPKLNIEFEDLGLTLYDGTPILCSVSGKFPHSRVTAVMGPSGAGKSTLLNVLLGQAGSIGRMTGLIKVNGREMKMSELRTITGFVPQEDIVHEDLTVRENLVYSARLRLSAGKPLKEQMALVDDVINILQLRHVQHNVVGSVERRGISGGQRKRVNLGWELAAKPSLLLADEPTSGLDATAAADVLLGLSRIAELGLNVVTVIHQPRYSIFTLFDDVMLLAKGGRLAYLGPSRLALDYFSSLGFDLPPNENPADFCLDVLSGGVPREDHSAPQPEELTEMWTSQGVSWVLTQSTIFSQGITTAVIPEHRIDPEQLRLLESAFEACDEDGEGTIDSSQMKNLLLSLGVEPTDLDVEMIMADLADGSSDGLISKETLLQYVKYGGRPPTKEPGLATRKRHKDSLYRVYSIEAGVLSSELANIATEVMNSSALMPSGSGNFSSSSSITVPRRRSAVGRKVSFAVVADASTSSAFNARITEGDEMGDGNEEKCVPSSPRKASQSSIVSRGSMESSLSRCAAAPKNSDKRWWMGMLSCCGVCTSKDSTLRVTPGYLGQFLILFMRSSIKWARGWNSKMMDLLLLIFAGVMCGAIHGTGGDHIVKFRGNNALVMLGLGLISSATALSVFGRDRVVFWRERASGMKLLPYFLAKTALNLLDVGLQPLVFLSIYYFMTLPAINFFNYYLIGVLVVWYCSSLGCLISVVVSPQNALVTAVSIIMLIGGFFNGVTPNFRDLSPGMRAITTLSYNRWATEAAVILNYQNLPPHVWPTARAMVNLAGYCGMASDPLASPSTTESLGSSALSPADMVAVELDPTVYCDGYAGRDLLILLGEGTALRLLTLIALWLCPKGLSIEPLVIVLNSWFGACRKFFKQRRISKRNKAAVNRKMSQVVVASKV